MDAALELRANASRAVERRRSKGSRALPAALGGVEDAAREPAACGSGAARDRDGTGRLRQDDARGAVGRARPPSVRMALGRRDRRRRGRPARAARRGTRRHPTGRPHRPCLSPVEGLVDGLVPARSPAALDRGRRSRRRQRSPAPLPQRDQDDLDPGRPRSAGIRAGARGPPRARLADRTASRGREAARAAGRRPGAEPARERRAPARAGCRAHGRGGRRPARALRGLGGGHPARRARSPRSRRRGFQRTQFRAGTIASWPSTFAPSSSQRSRPSCSPSSGGRRCSSS